jgi:hypothetical protein
MTELALRYQQLFPMMAFLKAGFGTTGYSQDK